MKLGSRESLLGFALLALVSVAHAQPWSGDAYGAGMMGYGPPAGMMGYGHGAGMMGNGYGPGMHGYGPGMMGDGYGPGMMGDGPGAARYLERDLGLTDDQRTKVQAIHDDVAQAQWDLAGKMQAEMRTMRALMQAEPRDRAAIEASFRRMSDLRQQRFSAMLAVHDRIDAVLTPEQRAKLRRAYQ